MQLVPQLDRVEWVLPDQVHLIDHSLNGVQHEVVRIRTEEQCAHRQRYDYENRPDHAHDCLHLRVPACVEQQQQLLLFGLVLLHHHRKVPFRFLQAEYPPRARHIANQGDPADSDVGDLAFRIPRPGKPRLDVLGEEANNVAVERPVPAAAGEEPVPVATLWAELLDVGDVGRVCAGVYHIAHEAELLQDFAGAVTPRALYNWTRGVVVVVVDVHEHLLLPVHAAVKCPCGHEVVPGQLDHFSAVLR
mmetsp:Transcript_51481/g.119670  ORF Transcript_51481/g.119670 Transcript_51481/m.119670 type:complete len:247 (-) Transcript_51481:1253-1993(-)